MPHHILEQIYYTNCKHTLLRCFCIVAFKEDATVSHFTAKATKRTLTVDLCQAVPGAANYIRIEVVNINCFNSHTQKHNWKNAEIA